MKLFICFFAQGNVLKAKFSDLDVDKDGHITESDLQRVKRAYSALGRRQKAKLYWNSVLLIHETVHEESNKFKGKSHGGF